jgi:hypothetical protein
MTLDPSSLLFDGVLRSFEFEPALLNNPLANAAVSEIAVPECTGAGAMYYRGFGWR